PDTGIAHEHQRIHPDLLAELEQPACETRVVELMVEALEVTGPTAELRNLARPQCRQPLERGFERKPVAAELAAAELLQRQYPVRAAARDGQPLGQVQRIAGQRAVVLGERHAPAGELAHRLDVDVAPGNAL